MFSAPQTKNIIFPSLGWFSEHVADTSHGTCESLIIMKLTTGRPLWDHDGAHAVGSWARGHALGMSCHERNTCNQKIGP